MLRVTGRALLARKASAKTAPIPKRPVPKPTQWREAHEKAAADLDSTVAAYLLKAQSMLLARGSETSHLYHTLAQRKARKVEEKRH